MKHSEWTYKEVNDFISQIKNLEAENELLKQKELKRAICSLVNIEDYLILKEALKQIADLKLSAYSHEDFYEAQKIAETALRQVNELG